ncbi:hypothetical protein SRRS_31290 [Sporomusa rhizae]|uniref:cytochrome c biogenesis protein CcsA n=1 Tax=Sporomusa rhizae TaxID=357999 RepID=UPI00352B5100
MIGYAAIALALVVSVAAAGLYLILINNKKYSSEKLVSIARVLYSVSTLLIGIAAVYLFYLILGNKFEYAYVFGYSSRELSIAYKLSVFWAGQEGSFLLWLVFHAIFGMVLLKRPAAPAGVMLVYCVTQSVLLVILLIKSPFMVLSEPHLNGAGLNLLLQDPWMVIHPPVVFLGYAALAVPFAYAISGLITGCHQEWVAPAKTWTLFALSSLGAGIFIGGFWAYKVLGWGGYWAWDPVENSSLAPWLAAGATAHLLLMAKGRAGAIRLAYVGVISSFLLVLYGTFLTRSGIVSDFSTHSFADEGIGGFLGIVVLAALTVSFGFYILRLPTMPSGELYPGVASREFILALTALLLVFFCVVVFAGMSTPLITMAFGSPKSVGSAFYNDAALPLAVVMGAALIIAPVVKMGGVSGGHPKQYWWLVFPAVMGISLADWITILDQPLITLVVCMAIAAAASQLYSAWRRGTSKGVACSHLGVAVILIGIMTSGAGSKSAIVSFTQGLPQQVFGERVTYIGTETEPAGEVRCNTFQVGASQDVVHSLTKLNKEGQPAAREPGIYRRLLSDLYIAPMVKTEEDHGPELMLVKGEWINQGEVQLAFVKFNMAGMDGDGPVRVQALIEVKTGSLSQEVRPELTNKNGQITGSTVKALDRYEIHIVGLKPGEGKVFIEFKDTFIGKATGQEQLEAEFSQKPLINLVWFGAFLITVGTGWVWSYR